MQKRAGAPIHHGLQPLLSLAPPGVQIAKSPRRGIILDKRIRKSFADFRSLRHLRVGGRLIRSLKQSEEALELRDQKTNPVLELQEVSVCALGGRDVVDCGEEVRFGEEGPMAVQTETDIQINCGVVPISGRVRPLARRGGV